VFEHSKLVGFTHLAHDKVNASSLAHIFWWAHTSRAMLPEYGTVEIHYLAKTATVWSASDQVTTRVSQISAMNDISMRSLVAFGNVLAEENVQVRLSTLFDGGSRARRDAGVRDG
jgi:hypothetical protein